MLGLFFTSGGVAIAGFFVLGIECVWLRYRRRSVPKAFVVAGAALLFTLLAGLRHWPWPWLAIALLVALVAQLLDLKARH